MSSTPTERIILGIDPGTNILGYGIITCTGQKMKLVTLGILDMQKMDDPMLKLQTIFERIIQLIEEYHPDEMAIEAPF
jgi:crossover junction endodeoxyribonuclease RuvC